MFTILLLQNQKVQKKTDSLPHFFVLLGSAHVENVDEIDTKNQKIFKRTKGMQIGSFPILLTPITNNVCYSSEFVITVYN